MDEILNNEDLDKLMNLTEDEFDRFLGINIPDGNISEVSDGEEPGDELELLKESAEDIERVLQNTAEPTQENIQTVEEEEVTEPVAGSSRAPSQRRKKNLQSWRFKKIPFEAPDVVWKDSLPPPPEEELTPYQYFRQYFNNELLEEICVESNRYAHQTDGKVLNITKNELEQFLSILLQMGIVEMPSVRLYWSNECRYAPIADLMSRNRFQQILHYFHVVDNGKMLPTTNPLHDKLFKVRPLLTALKTTMHDIPQEERHAVDEQIIPFKGRSGLKQYVKSKPHKWGYKVFTRAGSSGIIYDFRIYTGKNTADDHGLGFSGDIVCTLTENLAPNKNYKVYGDNFFSSLDLVQHLRTKDIFYLGTVRKDRMGKCVMSTEEELKKIGRGSHDHRVETTKNISLVRWLDRKSINFVSSFASVEPIDTCKRWSQQERKHIAVSRPYAVQEYNKFMGGVDLSDMLLELYRIRVRSNKWYMKIVFWCLGVAVVNSWLLYRRHEAQRNKKPQLALIQFHSSIARALADVGKLKLKKRGRPSNEQVIPTEKKKKRNVSVEPVEDVRRDNIGHEHGYYSKQGRCKLCKTGYTKVYCTKCIVRLCSVPNRMCFNEYHK